MLLRVIECDEDESCNVSIMQNTTSGELGATVWDAGLVMIHAFSAAPSYWRALLEGKRVLDMSCGTGAVGICLAKRPGIRPARVVLCDRQVLCELCLDNVKRNNVNASVVAFDWGDDVRVFENEGIPFDVLLLSDVVVASYASDYERLLTSLTDITHDDSLILLSVELRDPVDQDFFAMLRLFKFEYMRVNNNVLDPNWASDDIRMFLVRKRYDVSDDLYS
jgi:predicted nicotinamide N-methyase